MTWDDSTSSPHRSQGPGARHETSSALCYRLRGLGSPGPLQMGQRLGHGAKHIFPECGARIPIYRADTGVVDLSPP